MSAHNVYLPLLASKVDRLGFGTGYFAAAAAASSQAMRNQSCLDVRIRSSSHGLIF